MLESSAPFPRRPGIPSGMPGVGGQVEGSHCKVATPGSLVLRLHEHNCVHIYWAPALCPGGAHTPDFPAA